MGRQKILGAPSQSKPCIRAWLSMDKRFRFRLFPPYTSVGGWYLEKKTFHISTTVSTLPGKLRRRRHAPRITLHHPNLSIVSIIILYLLSKRFSSLFMKKNIYTYIYYFSLHPVLQNDSYLIDFFPELSNITSFYLCNKLFVPLFL